MHLLLEQTKQVLNSFRNSVLPKGVLREYLNATEIMKVHNDTLFVHGAITSKNVGRLPTVQNDTGTTTCDYDGDASVCGAGYYRNNWQCYSCPSGTTSSAGSESSSSCRATTFADGRICNSNSPALKIKMF